MAANVTGSNRGRRHPAKNLNISRRAFVASAGLATCIDQTASAQSTELIRFVKQSKNVILMQGQTPLWVVDARYFEASTPFSLLDSGQRLRISSLLAGLNIHVDLEVKIVKDVLSFASFGAPGELVSIADWKNHAAVKIRLRRDKEAETRIQIGKFGDQTVLLTAPFRFELSTQVQYTDPESESGTAAGLTFSGMTSFDTVAREVSQLLPGARSVAQIVLDGVTPDKPKEGWFLGSVGKRYIRLFFEAGAGRVILERIATPQTHWILRRHGTSFGRQDARLRYGLQEYGRDLHVGGVELFKVLTGGSPKSGFRVDRSPRPAYIEANRFAAAIRLLDNSFFETQPKPPRIELPIEVLVLHVAGEDNTRFDVDYRTVAITSQGPGIGEPGLNRSAIVWNTEGTTGLPASLTLGFEDSAATGNRLHLGEKDGAQLMLNRPDATGITIDSPLLRLRRAIDGLDLGLIFHNFRLLVGETSQLVALAGAQRGVRFHPQHLEEECFTDPIDNNLIKRTLSLFNSTALASGNLRPFGSSDNSAWFPKGPPTLLTRTQVSGASRIIFKPEPANTFKLTAEAVTDWRKLKLAVSSRAVGEIPVEAQLDMLGIAQDTKRNDAKKKVQSSLNPPAPDQTSLEMVTGLFYSPEETAHFRTTAFSGGKSSLWTAELDLEPLPNAAQSANQQKTSVVRAIWASGLNPKSLFDDACQAEGGLGFPTSTSGRDRIEIALQSSAFGLAARRDVTLQGVDVPNSRVRRVAQAWQFIDQDMSSPDGSENPNLRIVKEGVFSPAPFKHFQARLTGFGGDLDAEWQAEPVVPYDSPRLDRFFKNAFSVERYIHRTRQRSDVFAQVVYKGYLFPYPFIVSLVKITQREPFTLPEAGAMMPLITRYYLISKQVTKAFPGIYQPFSGRELPMTTARLLLDCSPELQGGDAMEPPPELDLLPIDLAPANCKPSDGFYPRVFWPVLKAGGPYHFDFLADDSSSRRTLPMLFVSNLDANRPDSVRKIINYYNSLRSEQRREEHYRQMTVFAPPRSASSQGSLEPVNETGSTSFETDHIILKVRPRPLPESARNTPQSNDDRAYMIDPFMSGAGETPWYACAIEASIIIPALDRMMGAPQGLKKVGYTEAYVRHGFDPKTNPAELYLNFLDHNPLVDVMRLGGDGRVSGGLAQTPTLLAGISRINTIVGAPRSTKRPAIASSSGNGLPPAGADGGWNFTNALKGEFNPEDFFKEATLMGVVGLANVIETGRIDEQPKLKEVYEYDLGASDTANAFKDACKSVAELIAAALKEADKALKRIFSANESGLPAPDPGEITVERYYPQLWRQLDSFARLLNNVPDVSGLPLWASKLSSQWRSTKTAIDAVIANPSPEPLRAGMAELRSFIDALEGDLGEHLQTILKDARNRLVASAMAGFIESIISACFDATGKLSAPWFFEAVSGSIADAAATPDALRRRLAVVLNESGTLAAETAKSLLSEALTAPLLTVLARVKVFDQTLADIEKLTLDAVAAAAGSILHAAAEAMADIDALIDCARHHASQLCAATSSVFKLELLCRLALDVVPPATDITSAVNAVFSAWPDLDLPDLPDSAGVTAARQASARLRTAVNDLNNGLATLSQIRDSITTLTIEDLCRDEPQQLATLIARLNAARDSIFPAFERCATDARELAKAYGTLPASELTDAKLRLKAIHQTLISLAFKLTCAGIANLAKRLEWLDTVPVVGERIAGVKADAINAGDDLRQQVAAASNATIDDLNAVVQSATNQSHLEQKLFKLCSDFCSLTDDLVAAIVKIREEIVQEIAPPVVKLHTLALELADKAIGVFEDAPDLVKLFTQAVYKTLLEARENIRKDHSVLVSLSTATTSQAFADLLARWRAGNFALVATVRQLMEFFTAIMAGQIGGIFDLSAVRRAAEAAVRQLIPTRVNLSYDWVGKLKPYRIFAPEPGGTITIKTLLSVDLINPADRKIEVTGTLSRFDLELVGSPDLVTITLDKTHFIYRGGVPQFSTTIVSARPGPALGFFNKLSSLLGGSDNGVYVEPVLSPSAGIRVGYRYSKEFLELGGLQVTNFGFDASLTLFLNTAPALTRFAVASREKPCGVVIFPAYYGACYIALTATARGIETFEIQLEFGAARDLRFGPLRGQASVSAGIYLLISLTSGERVLEGFVHATGEGSVACFGISIDFAVRVKQQSDSKDIKGTATFRFSFRIGFFSVDYSVPAEYTFSQNLTSRSFAVKSLGYLPAEACVPLPDKRKEWLCYRDNFVFDWDAA